MQKKDYSLIMTFRDQEIKLSPVFNLMISKTNHLLLPSFMNLKMTNLMKRRIKMTNIKIEGVVLQERRKKISNKVRYSKS